LDISNLYKTTFCKPHYNDLGNGNGLLFHMTQPIRSTITLYWANMGFDKKLGKLLKDSACL